MIMARPAFTRDSDIPGGFLRHSFQELSDLRSSSDPRAPQDRPLDYDILPGAVTPSLLVDGLSHVQIAANANANTNASAALAGRRSTGCQTRAVQLADYGVSSRDIRL